MTSARTWPGAALYDVSIRHHRRDPVVNRFVYGSYYWLIDVDQPPRAANRLAVAGSLRPC